MNVSHGLAKANSCGSSRAVRRDVETAIHKGRAARDVKFLGELTAVMAVKAIRAIIGASSARKDADLNKPASPSETTEAEEMS